MWLYAIVGIFPKVFHRVSSAYIVVVVVFKITENAHLPLRLLNEGR